MSARSHRPAPRPMKLLMIIVRQSYSSNIAVILRRASSLNVRAEARSAAPVSPYMDLGMNFFHRPWLFTQLKPGLLLIPRSAHPALLNFSLFKAFSTEAQWKAQPSVKIIHKSKKKKKKVEY